MSKIKAKGVAINYGDSADPATPMPQLAEVGMDLGAWDRADNTTHDTSGKTKTYDTMLKEPPSIDVTLFLDPADTAHDWLVDTHAAGTLAYHTLIMPDAGAATWKLSGHITNLSISPLRPDGYVQASYTFAGSAAPTYAQ